MENNLEFKTYEFDRPLILAHYIALFVSSIIVNMILSPINNTLAQFTITILIIILGLMVSKQVWEIRYNEREIKFLLWLGKTRQVKWKEINSLIVDSYGREVYTITSDRRKIKIDTYHCRKNAPNILNTIVDSAQLTLREAKWPNRVIYRKADSPENETSSH